ncbi:MAG: hypothetical protein WC569_03335 [Candidatus Omnitrophota bacterium]
MKTGYYVISVFLCLVFLSCSVFAAPVGLTSEADLLESTKLFRDLNEMGLGLSLGFYADIVNEREIEIERNGEFEMDMYMARLSLTANDRFTLYFDIGQAKDPVFSYHNLGSDIKIFYEDESAWGTGLNVLIHRFDNNIEVGAHAGYRQYELSLDKVMIDGAQYAPGALTNISEDNYKEYQAAVEIGWKADYMRPYLGVKYSDVELGSDFTLAPQTYSAKGKRTDSNLGLFAGVTLTPELPFYKDTRQLAINVEGRFVDEQALSMGVTYKF